MLCGSSPVALKVENRCTKRSENVIYSGCYEVSSRQVTKKVKDTRVKTLLFTERIYPELFQHKHISTNLLKALVDKLNFSHTNYFLYILRQVGVLRKGVKRLDGARARSKFGVPMFEPGVFRKQMYCIEESACDIVETFRRPHSVSAPGESCPPSVTPLVIRTFNSCRL